MSDRKRYPAINIRSKNEIAKRISSKDLPYKRALFLINDVIKNFNKYWYDSDCSKPEEEKFVRSAVGTPLGKLLKLVDLKILAPYDKMVPDFIFGGVSGRNHIEAAYSLIGKRRTLLKLDIRRFFEQVAKKRVFYFFYKKCGCSAKAARILSELCCVKQGPKGNQRGGSVLARGFATSPRLALWCTLNTFLRLSWKAKKKLHGHDPRIAIFVDDIGVTANKISVEEMELFADEVVSILAEFDKNQPLPTNLAKRKVVSYNTGLEHLGLKLGRIKLSMGGKSKSKMDKIMQKLKGCLSLSEKRLFLQKKKAYYVYKKQISRAKVRN